MIRRAGDSHCQNEGILVPSQDVISEIKTASILRTPCPDSPACRAAYPASDSPNRRASVKVRSVEKGLA